MARHARRDDRYYGSSRGQHGHSGRSASGYRTAHYGAQATVGRRSSGGRGKGPLVFGIIVAILVIASAAFVADRFFLDGGADAPQKLENEGAMITVTVPEGSSTHDIATALEESGLVESAGKFSKFVEKAGAEASFKPGTYRIICGTSMEEIVEMLEMGPEVTTVAIPEGYTIAKTAKAVEESSDGRIAADDFMELAENAKAYAGDYPFLKGAASGTLEGFLFPKTYEIADNATADSMIRLMLDQYQKEINGLDFSYPESQGLSAYETVIMASIIEREAAPQNRETVSSVFYNRLSEGMPLQSDATVAYLIDGDPTPEDLKMESPYNTYLVEGLPLGPICSPSLASLKAACSPEKTDYLYFYFTADGEYSFSENYDDHQDAIARD